MIEYTIEMAKKENELKALEYFLDAYGDITSESLEIADLSERPDFICVRNNRI